MKKTLYLLAAAGLLFAGALYRYAFLTALAAALLLLFFGLFAVSRLRAKASAGFDRTRIETERGEDAELKVTLRNVPRRVPDGPVRADVTAEGRKLRLRALSASDGPVLKLSAAHCGLTELRLDRVILSDPAGLFGAPCGNLGPVSFVLTVWPRRKGEARPEDLPLLPEDEADVLVSRNSGSREPDGVREYRPGDPIRRVHWKLSARTDELYLREFREEAAPVRLLDPSAWAGLGEADPDAFYDALHDAASAVLEAGEWIALPGEDGLTLVTDVSGWYAWLRRDYERMRSEKEA